jgi:hypothetical protein
LPVGGTRRKVPQTAELTGGISIPNYEETMAETFDQYRERVLGYLGDLDPVVVMLATPAKLARKLRGLTAEQLRRRPKRGKWSIVEIVAHMADAELAFAWRYRLMIAREGAPLVWFDDHDWAIRFRYRDADAAATLALFRALRESNMKLLARVPRRKWGEFWGQHEKRGRQTVADFVTMEGAHDLNHLRQIDAILKLK